MTIAAAVGLAALTLQGGWLPVATLLLLPVFLAALLDAARTATGLWREWRAHELGANVKRALATLGPAYRVVTRGASLAERDRHVAIGPNGVFLIVSSDDGGRVTASDQRLFVNARLPWRNLVEDCRVEALRVSDRVQRALGRPVPVHAVLCFTRALVAVGQEIRGVKIVQVPRLARFIESVAIVVVVVAGRRRKRARGPRGAGAGAGAAQGFPADTAARRGSKASVRSRSSGVRRGRNRVSPSASIVAASRACNAKIELLEGRAVVR